MKLSKFPVGVALFTTTFFLLVFCQKEDPFNKSIPETDNPKVSFIAADDPAFFSAVPIIVPITV
jgi:hypothetical protein